VSDRPGTPHPDASPGEVVRPDGETGKPVPGAGALGMVVFLASLSVLFLASLVGYLVIRVRADVWPPAGSPDLPGSLWLSTAVILASSLTVHLALAGIRKGNPVRLLVGLLATTALGVAFLMLQAFNWIELVGVDVSPKKDLYGFTFYLLTGLHAAHVVGGLIPLGITVVRAFLGRYTWASYSGVRNVAMYWHFLDVVWLVMFALLWFGS
jgi:cytochrome c oxidase subunit 3